MTNFLVPWYSENVFKICNVLFALSFSHDVTEVCIQYAARHECLGRSLYHTLSVLSLEMMDVFLPFCPLPQDLL